MATVESIPNSETYAEVPLPGSVAHLKFLESLDIAEGASLFEPRVYLEKTFAVTSFSRFIRRYRTLSPLDYRQRIDMDSRFMMFGPRPPQIFRGSVEMNPNLENAAVLMVHGRPNPQDKMWWADYTYDVTIPMTDAQMYDPNRPIQALVKQGNAHVPHTYHAWAYNELVDPNHRPDDLDKRAFFYAMRQAARDMLDAFDRLSGVSRKDERPSIEPAPPELARWHPDYLTDHPDEFLKPA